MAHTIDELILLPDSYKAVLAIENHLNGKGKLTTEAASWKQVVEFRSHIHCDGLWHAYGDICEHDGMEELQESFALAGFQDAFDLFHADPDSKNKDEEEREIAVLSLISDEKLLNFVSRNRDAF